MMSCGGALGKRMRTSRKVRGEAPGWRFGADDEARRRDTARSDWLVRCPHLSLARVGLWERLAESSRSASLTLAEPADLPAKLLLETQARRLGLGLLPGVAVAAVGALAREVGVPARIEEYYVDTVYRTAFEKDDYTDVQLELLFS